MNPSPEFWKHKRVFVTGHTGFKGTWLSLLLQSMGAEVLGYALDPPTNPAMYLSTRAWYGMRSVIEDVRDSVRLEDTLRNFQPEIVLHLAAQAVVKESYLDPKLTYETNVMGTVNLLEAVRLANCIKSVVCITSDKCYESREQGSPFVEGDRMGGYDPYSSSKGCAELVIASYRNSFFNPDDYGRHGTLIASARAGNVIGGGDWGKNRLVPDIIRSFTDKDPVLIRSPDAIRPWQFVLEPLIGYLLLAEQLYNGNKECSGPFNFGPNIGSSCRVWEIADRLTVLWGNGASYKIDKGEHQHETKELRIDSSKASALLGWKPRLSLNNTLKEVVAWHRSKNSDKDMFAVTSKQIESFLKADPDCSPVAISE